MDDYQYELPLTLIHDPVSGYPRKNHIGENVFHAQWKKLMEIPVEIMYNENECMLHVVLSNLYRQITQRDATVAASFITWLGTNIGYSYIGKCHHLIETYPINKSRKFIFLEQWNIQNLRKLGNLSSHRTIEIILNAKYRSDVTINDYEVIECITLWLSEDDGYHFLHICKQADVDYRNTLKYLDLKMEQY